SPPCCFARRTRASRWAESARLSTISTALAGPVWARPSVSLAATTATTPRPSSLASPRVPFSTIQPRTACLPPRFMSALAKQGPVQTSQVRASMYLPVMPAALSGPARTTRARTAARATVRFIAAVLLYERGGRVGPSLSAHFSAYRERRQGSFYSCRYLISHGSPVLACHALRSSRRAAS